MSKAPRDPLALGHPPEAYFFRWTGGFILALWLYLIIDPTISSQAFSFYSSAALGAMGLLSFFALFVLRAPEGAHMKTASLILIRLLALLLPFFAPGYASVVLQIRGMKQPDLSLGYWFYDQLELSAAKKEALTKYFTHATAQYADQQALWFTAFVVGGITLALVMFLLPAMEARRRRRGNRI